MFVNPRLLFTFLEKNITQNMKLSMYIGRVLNEGPIRNIESKWYISPEEFKADMYPPLVTAGFILFSSQSLPRFYNESKYHTLFKLDDVHVALLAQHLNIKPIHMPNIIHLSESDVAIENANTIISAHSYSPTKLAEIWRQLNESIGIDKSYLKKLLDIYRKNQD